MHVCSVLGRGAFAGLVLVISVSGVSLNSAFLQEDRRSFVWLSDVHVDPYYSSGSAVCSSDSGALPGGQALPEGTPGCDPPMSLWLSAVKAAARFGRDAAFVLQSGDSVRHLQHKMPDPARDVTNVLGSVAEALKRAFPWLGPREFVMGSPGNDDTPRSYEVNITTGSPVNPWLANMASVWWRNGVMSEDIRAAYSYGGFFETEVGGLRILSINTLIYSVLHQPPGPAPEDPFGQLAWLRSRLERTAAEGRRAWIVGHIPPGTETYSYTPLWQSKYVQAYLDVVEDPLLGNAVGAQLFGHVHRDEFRVLPHAPPGAGPVVLTGALSPIYDCNPSFRLVEYDGASGRLLNIKVFWAQLPSEGGVLDWRFGYDYLSAYPTLRQAAGRDGGLTNGAFAGFSRALWLSQISRGEEFGTFADWYLTQAASDLNCCALEPGITHAVTLATKQRYMGILSCGMNITTDEQFDSCAQPHSIDVYTKWFLPSMSGDWPGYREARTNLWKNIATEPEQAEVHQGCGHMVSVVRRA